ncbi:MAG: tetratricopeptide repeat-containing protein [Xanthomonadaceae bacterium]|nr:tetratricopeptide repeat-containing protein [Xanthomonadaceae bacterium]
MMNEQPDLTALAQADQQSFGRWLGEMSAAAKGLRQRLTQHCARRGLPLVLEAAAPGAAAAALDHWARRYAVAHADALVLVHHLGCTRESRQLNHLLFRLLSGLRQGRGLREALPVTLEGRIEVLPNWLARAAATGKVVLVLTGLESLEGGAADEDMAWLPRYLPPGARLIVSVAPGAACEVLRRRGWQHETLALAPLPLDVAELRDLAAEESALLRLLWGARRGVPELLLRQAGLETAALAGLARRGLVYQGANGWALAGARSQDLVRRQLLREGVEQQAVYLELSRLYAATPQALDALPWLLPAAAHWQALADWLGDCRVLQALLQPGRRDDLLGCWQAWGLGEGLIEFYCSRLDDWRARLSPPDFGALVVELSLALRDLLEQPNLEPLFARARERAGELPPMAQAALDAACGAWLNDVERLAEAEPLLRRALAAREQLLGDDHPDSHAVRHQLAMLLEKRGELDQAAVLYQTTLRLREQALGERHVDLIPHLANLAAVRKAAQDFAGARPLLERALALAERHCGNGHPTTAACLDSLAGLLYAGHDHEQAETLYQRALGVVETAFGPAHPATAASLHNLATLLDVREQYRTAEQLFARALAIRQEVYGEEHVDTASTLHNLAGVLDAMGDSAQAEPMYRRAIAVWEKLVGVEHPATATSINNLADLLREKGEYAEAEQLYRRNLATWSKLLGEEHPHAIMTRAELAALYAEQDQFELAEPLLRQACEQTARVMGEDSMLHINSVIRLSVLLRDSGRRPEALQLLRDAVARAEGRMSPLSPRLQKLRRHLEAMEKNPTTLH